MRQMPLSALQLSLQDLVELKLTDEESASNLLWCLTQQRELTPELSDLLQKAALLEMDAEGSDLPPVKIISRLHQRYPM